MITSFLFIPALIYIAWAGGIYYLILIELGIFLGTYEFFDILRAKGLRPYKSLGILAAIVLGLNSYYQSHIFTFLTPAGLLFAVSIAELFRKEQNDAIFHISSTLFGVIYVGWLFSHLILLNNMPAVLPLKDYYNIFHIRIKLSTSFALLPFVLTWTNDSMAYFIGKRFGRHSFFSRISPKKTWEGVIGGGVASVIAAFIYQQIYAPYLSWFDCVVLGVLVAYLAPIGDLVESMIKRDVKLKDSSAIIPGHGGFLDRFDSILFTAPVIYYYLRFFAAR